MNMHTKTRKALPAGRQGFTLIELLVVIAVIGMLASIVFVALGPARARARDTKRVSDIRQISTAMDLCYGDTACNTVNDSTYLAIAADVNRRLTTTAVGTYIPTLPADPGGGAALCTTAASTVETAAGAYCAYTSPAGAEYCIYARLSDGRVFAASEKGSQYMAAVPASLSACP
ncbi:MAG: prepilin-type N-terminal cleavage/methylation domain-containing protein [Candidatus Wildermuthbacteria bacterium]|nr:prepilin-type N-terminal cleavage/methylation domain-containing protein [Candidatus Wildermuthbacteria bacterium]